MLPVLSVAVADCPCEDGPRLQPLPIAKSRGERSRTFPCKHTPVQLAFDGFDLLYRLWTLPYNFLARIICATVSVIVRRRRASPVRADNPAAPRYAAARHCWSVPSVPVLCGVRSVLGRLWMSAQPTAAWELLATEGTSWLRRARTASMKLTGPSSCVCSVTAPHCWAAGALLPPYLFRKHRRSEVIPFS